MTEGVKDDQGKLMYRLVDDVAQAEFVAALTYGATCYGVDNWRELPDLRDRMYDALMRHLAAFRMGEHLDPDDELHHLAKAKCCVHFILAEDLGSQALEPLKSRLPRALERAAERREARLKRAKGAQGGTGGA